MKLPKKQLNEERLKQQQITQRETEMRKCIEKANKEARERQKPEQEVMYQLVNLTKLLMIFKPCHYLNQPSEERY